VAWAGHQFKLNLQDENGTTERDHLKQVERQTGRKLKALEPPTPFPSLIAHVWSAFIALNSSRESGFSGPTAISYVQIKAWKELTETSILPWEIEAIKRLDSEYLRVANG